jgi:ribonucleoside-diphosphate reductase alpha chain
MPSQQKPHLGLEDLKDAMPVAEVSADVAVKEDTQAPAKPPMGFGAIAQQVPASSAVPVANMRVSSKMVMKRDGTRAPFNADQINKSIERATYGLANPLEKVMQIASETELTIYDGITTEEMDQATINAALQNAQYDLDYDKIATRLLVKTIYKKVLGTYDTKEELVTMHKAHFQHYVRLGVELNLLDKRLKQFDLDELGRYLKLERDEFYKYSGMSTMMDRYLIKDTDGKPLETPQYFWMRIAMAMAIPEKDKMGMAKKFYDKMSKLEYLSAGSTNIGAGTTRSSLSNCYLMQIEDDMEHIGKTVQDVLMLSKATGGIGLAVTKLRANGSILKSNNTVSSGPVPFMHIIDSAVRAVQRGGKKKGALCFYMENWHYDFQDFIDLKQNAGDDYRRTRTANTAVYMSDEFMKRVRNDQEWYLFDPKETPDLVELYGEAFSKRYEEYCQMAERGELVLWKKMSARQQYKIILVSMQTTSHPWLTWKDTINVRALNNNTGTIHCSNLCTEVTLPQDKDTVAVCNLISLNLPRHLVGKQMDWMRLEESTRLAIRQLDNLVDVNVPPIAEAKKADSENRALGLGLMGLSDTIEQLGLSYEDPQAHDFFDKVMEFISYMAIDESANIAVEKGSYKNFEGSGWSRGMVPIDTLEKLAKGRGVPLTVATGSVRGVPEIDWDTLRKKVRKGMRNATVMAIAPNANIGLVAGTSPGIDPRFAQMFSRNKISGKYLEINPNLVHDLKAHGFWEKYQEEILTNHGDIQSIDGIPDEIKRIYKTSFGTSPYAFVEVAARAQKWVDQAISRNMYLSARDIDNVMDIYSTAWEKGLKTTYYLHMQPKHTAEQSTTNVNKSTAIGKKGFGALFTQSAPVMMSTPTPAPVEIRTETVTVAVEQEKIEVIVEKTVVEEKPPAGPFAAVAQAPKPFSKPPTVILPEDPADAMTCEGCQ